MDECCSEFVQSVYLKSNFENGSNFKKNGLYTLSEIVYCETIRYFFENVFLYTTNTLYYKCVSRMNTYLYSQLTITTIIGIMSLR